MLTNTTCPVVPSVFRPRRRGCTRVYILFGGTRATRRHAPTHSPTRILCSVGNAGVAFFVFRVDGLRRWPIRVNNHRPGIICSSTGRFIGCSSHSRRHRRVRHSVNIIFIVIHFKRGTVRCFRLPEHELPRGIRECRIQPGCYDARSMGEGIRRASQLPALPGVPAKE